MLAIYKRELKSYFHSMTGCVFIAFLVMFTGIYFMAYNLNAGVSLLLLHTLRLPDRISGRDPASDDAEFF